MPSCQAAKSLGLYQNLAPSCQVAKISQVFSTWCQLKNSWRCLSKLRVKDPAYAAEIIKAVIVLHNRRMDQNPEDLPAPEMGTTEARAAGKQKQNELINFFVR
ncbi:hypothetical protein DdX_21101 [Ditylenchus destructor]|uniref:Uncharacterized protein n=1 Tax=Ditylenchus destructor TaxID=166010 RepID=A0AAD4QVK4_9BILA|nr:hypothetical protein DdX_21101 [Ditylenchus destructor]